MVIVRVQQSRVLPIVLLFLGFTLAGCRAAHPLVPVPASLQASSSVMMVERSRKLFNDKPMKFGEWQVSEFRRDRWPERDGFRIGRRKITLKKSSQSTGYSFLLTGNGEPWDCHCEQTRQRRGLSVGSRELSVLLTHDDLLRCELQRTGSDEVWQFEAGGRVGIEAVDYTGKLFNGEHVVFLRASNEIQGLGELPGPPLGYIFEREGRDIASAELIHPGAVRIADTTGSEREAIASAAAALLLQSLTKIQ